jgi:hypothetical protein
MFFFQYFAYGGACVALLLLTRHACQMLTRTLRNRWYVAPLASAKELGWMVTQNDRDVCMRAWFLAADAFFRGHARDGLRHVECWIPLHAVGTSMTPSPRLVELMMKWSVHMEAVTRERTGDAEYRVGCVLWSDTTLFMDASGTQQAGQDVWAHVRALPTTSWRAWWWDPKQEG